MYIPLHGHSTFSFLESIGKPKDIIKKAKELGFSAIGLTDFNVIYGLIQFYQAANGEGIKPILGVEVGFVFDVHNVRNIKNVGGICLLAKDDQGYLNLLKLITYASQEGIEGRPKIDFQALEKYKEGILCFSGGIQSWLFSMMKDSESNEKVEEAFDMLVSLLGKDSCFLEVVAQDESNSDIKRINKFVLDLSKKNDISCIVSNEYIYPSKDDKITYELAMAIKDNLTIYDANHRVPQTENHMMTEEEIRSICQKNGYDEKEIDNWIETTQKVADMCNAKIEMGQKLFPKYEVEPEVLQLYEKNKDNLIVE